MLLNLFQALSSNSDVNVTFAVPKFDVRAHRNLCLRLYHPDRVSGCALTDGEASERQWSKIGRYHYILKECRSETRLEILEDVLLMIYFDLHSSILKLLKTNRVKSPLSIKNFKEK
jgi:hypothetical protein